MSEGVDSKGWQRWHMQDMGAAHPPAAHSSQTLCLVDGVVKKAWQQARTKQTQVNTRQQGYEDGHKQGLKEGFEKGQEQGWDEGQKKGWDAGYEEGYKAGYAVGHETGKTDGLRAGEQQSQAILIERTERLDSLLGAAGRELAQLGEQLNAQLSRAVLELALGIARQITQSSLQVNQAALLDTLQNVLKRQPEQPQGASLRLYVHPDDEQILTPFLQTLPQRPDWQIITDKKIEVGGCVLHTELGQVDATLQTRWQRAMHAAQSVLPMQPQQPRQTA